MFYIGFVALPRTDADGRRRARGEITLGADSVAFEADLDQWSASEYDHQWREGIARLAAGESRSALVTSYGGPNEARHELWPMRRDGSTVTIGPGVASNAPIGPEAMSESFYALAADADPFAAPQWTIPLGHLLAFIAHE